MPTPHEIPSVRRFLAPEVQSPFDLDRNPSRAVAYWMTRDIVRGVFAPDERLKIDRLSRFYDIGHGPIREAILLVSGLKLIHHEPQRGYRVAPVSLADFLDLFNAYHALYRLALTMAVERGDQAWEDRVVLQLHRSLKVRKTLFDGDPEAREMWQRAYRSFHSAILSGCNSPVLLEFNAEISNRVERYVNLFADLQSDRDRDHATEHMQLVDALIARDTQRLLALINRYFAIAEPIRASIEARLSQGPAALKKRGRRSAAPESKASPRARRRRTARQGVR